MTTRCKRSRKSFYLFFRNLGILRPPSTYTVIRRRNDIETTIKLPIRVNDVTRHRLTACVEAAAAVWNDCLSVQKQYAIQNGGKWIVREQLLRAVSIQPPLHQRSVEAVIDTYLKMRQTTKTLRDKGFDKKYPYKAKAKFVVKWGSSSFHLSKDGRLSLLLSIDGLPNFLCVRLPKKKLQRCFNEQDECSVREIELTFNQSSFFLCLTVRHPNKLANPNKKQNVAAIDFGEIHSISSVSESGHAVVITGRKIRSIHRLRNKKIAEIQRMMARCRIGSRQWVRLRKIKEATLKKSADQLSYLLHKVTKLYVDWCVEHGVTHVVIGNVEGVQRFTSAKNKKKKLVRSKRLNQKISNWQFGVCSKYLAYKLNQHGITTSKINESYTTLACPVCKTHNKSVTRNYACLCGYENHRDIHAAGNILTKFIHGSFKPVTINHQTYLRTVKNV